MRTNLVCCPECNSKDVNLTVIEEVSITYSQNENGIADEYEEDLNGRCDDEVEAKCRKCNHEWTYAGVITR